MHIDVYHDTVCPWCRIGWRHLQIALERWQGEPVTVRHQPFFLNPDVPAEGYDFIPYMSQKFAGRVDLNTLFERPTQAGANVGLTFNFDRVGKSPNTLLSHRLIELAPEDKREEVVSAIYDAYFEHGRDIGQLDTLVEIAAEVGLDADAIRAALEGDDAKADVLEKVTRAQRLGVQGVPLFVMDNRLAFSGAQPPEVMLQAMQQAVDQRELNPR
jgi:predicted DsbA family dithiol-disulfide isomerase